MEPIEIEAWIRILIVASSILVVMELHKLLHGALFHRRSFKSECKSPVVYVVPIEGIIDLGLAPFIQRVLKQATDGGTAAVILDINTFGGRVDAAVLLRDTLLNARVPYWLSKSLLFRAGKHRRCSPPFNAVAFPELRFSEQEQRCAGQSFL